jgi:ABC-2 type transport system ATP-binding protein
MIEVKNLKKQYGAKTAVKDISFNVEAGEIFGFLGPNGAGKTTTIKILTGQLLPSYGEVSVMGLDVIKCGDELHGSIGVVPENANLYERLTVRENLEFFCRLYDCKTDIIGYYLEQVRLAAEKNTQVKKLSKGTKQRVLLIRALLHRPKVLFLDEPTSGLDPSSAADIHDLLKRLNAGGMTILLTSHNMEEVDRLCGRVAFIDDGVIVDSGTTRELKMKYADNSMKILLKKGASFEEKQLGMAGEEAAASLAQWVREGRLISIHSCEPTLGEIFMKLTGRKIA